MKKLLVIVVLVMIVCAGVYAQEKDEYGAINLSKYMTAAYTYLKWSGKYFTNDEVEKIIQARSNDFYENKNNEFKWKPYLEKWNKTIKDEIAGIDVNGMFYFLYTATVGEYQFDKEGFWAVMQREGNGNYHILYGNGFEEWSPPGSVFDNSGLTPVVFLVQMFPYSYFFPMGSERAQALVKEMTSKGNRNVYLKIFYALEETTTKW